MLIRSAIFQSPPVIYMGMPSNASTADSAKKCLHHVIFRDKVGFLYHGVTLQLFGLQPDMRNFVKSPGTSLSDAIFKSMPDAPYHPENPVNSMYAIILLKINEAGINSVDSLVANFIIRS